MTIDPETLRQIEELSQDDRPLLVLDVDDVLLDFARPFPRYLESRGFQLRLDSFRLTGNVFETGSEIALDRDRTMGLLDDFFSAQTEWQTLVAGASDTVATIAEDAEVVLLTAMPHRHRGTRRKYLDTLGLNYPLLTTEMAKGPAIHRLRGKVERPVAFVDDMPHNLASARESVVDTHLFHLMADTSLRAMMPAPPEGAVIVDTWHEAGERIAEALGL